MPMPRLPPPLSLGLLLVATPSLASSSAGQQFEHRDWQLACDNTRTCRAAGYTAEADRGDASDAGGVSVLLTRKAGPGQPVTAEVRFADWYDEALPQAPVHLHIDGRDLGPLPAPAPDDPALTTLRPAQVDALRSALLRDSRIVFVDGQRARWPLSDAGAAAVLLKMDEAQGRLGTTGALVRRGARDERDVLPAVPVPQVRAAAVPALRPDDAGLAALPAVADALRASLDVDQTCDGLEPEYSGQPLEVAARLDAQHVLVTTGCWTGAYNGGAGYWVMRDSAPWQAELVTMDAVGYEDGQLFAGHKGRGLGDCFWTAAWTWDGRGFVQTSEETTGLCRGITAGGAWSLPTRVADVVR